jgi:hypothetical protein
MSTSVLDGEIMFLQGAPGTAQVVTESFVQFLSRFYEACRVFQVIAWEAHGRPTASTQNAHGLQYTDDDGTSDTTIVAAGI